MEHTNHEVWLLIRTLQAIERKQEGMMAAIDDLKANVQALAAQVDKVVAKGVGVSEADVAQAASDVAAQTAKLMPLAP